MTKNPSENFFKFCSTQYKAKQDREERLVIEREKRRVREERKRERMAKVQQLAEQQIKKAKNEPKNAQSAGRSKKIPERFSNGVDDSVLDLYTSDEMSLNYTPEPSKPASKVEPKIETEIPKQEPAEVELEYEIIDCPESHEDKFVPQMTVKPPAEISDPKNAILMPRVKIPPPKRIINWQPNSNQSSNRQPQQRGTVIQPNILFNGHSN